MCVKLLRKVKKVTENKLFGRTLKQKFSKQQQQQQQQLQQKTNKQTKKTDRFSGKMKHSSNWQKLH